MTEQNRLFVLLIICFLATMCCQMIFDPTPEVGVSAGER